MVFLLNNLRVIILLIDLKSGLIIVVFFLNFWMFFLSNFILLKVKECVFLVEMGIIEVVLFFWGICFLKMERSCGMEFWVNIILLFIKLLGKICKLNDVNDVKL